MPRTMSWVTPAASSPMSSTRGMRPVPTRIASAATLDTSSSLRRSAWISPPTRRTAVTSVFRRTSMASRAKATDRICAASRSSWQEQRHALDDDHAAAEAAEHLCQLAAQRAAADDQQPPGQGADAEDGFVGEVAHVAQAGDVGHVGLGAGCDQGLVEAQPDAVEVEVVGGLEHGMAEEQVDAGPAQHPWRCRTAQ